MKFKSFIFKTITLMTILFACIASDVLSQTENTPDATVAIVNDIPITEADVTLEVKRILFQAKAMQKPLDQSMMLSMREKVIDSLINRELLYQQSKAKGITTDEADIDNSIDQIKQRLEAGQSFENLLVGDGDRHRNNENSGRPGQCHPETAGGGGLPASNGIGKRESYIF